MIFSNFLDQLGAAAGASALPQLTHLTTALNHYYNNHENMTIFQFLQEHKMFGKLAAIAKGSSKDKVVAALTAFEADPAVSLIFHVQQSTPLSKGIFKISMEFP